MTGTQRTNFTHSLLELAMNLFNYNIASPPDYLSEYFSSKEVLHPCSFPDYLSHKKEYEIIWK